LRCKRGSGHVRSRDGHSQRENPGANRGDNQHAPEGRNTGRARCVSRSRSADGVDSSAANGPAYLRVITAPTGKPAPPEMVSPMLINPVVAVIFTTFPKLVTVAALVVFAALS
jgi:hypothetical protein